MTDDIWEARRKQKSDTAIKAVMDLFEHMGAAAFVLNLDPNTPGLILAAGMRDDVREMVK